MTTTYLGLELLSRNSVIPNESSDIYALGITLFEMCSSCDHPFEKEFGKLSEILIIQAVLDGVRPRMDSFPTLYKSYDANLVARLCNLITLCWQEDQLSRPTAAEVIQFLLKPLVFKSKNLIKVW